MTLDLEHQGPIRSTQGATGIPSATPSQRLHVVIVDEEFPYPLNWGKGIRGANLVLRLANRRRITCLAYRNADPKEECQPRDSAIRVRAGSPYS